MTNISSHLSKDDAKMTMMILKTMCENLELPVTELLELFLDYYYDSNEYFEDYEFRKEENRLHPGAFTRRHSSSNSKFEYLVIWGELYREHHHLLKKEGNMNVITNTIETIQKNNFVAYDEITSTDYLIVYYGEDKKILAILKHPYNSKWSSKMTLYQCQA